MESDIRIDRSLSRGLIRQTLRNSAEFIRDPHDDETKWHGSFEHRVIQCILRNRKNHPHLNPKGFDRLEREIAGLKPSRRSRLFHSRLEMHPHLPHRSRYEMAARNELINCERRIGASVFHIGLSKYRLALIQRMESMLIGIHALERHVQRAVDMELKENRVLDAIEDSFSLKGFGMFLMATTNRETGSSFVIPYRDGLWLCRIETVDGTTPVIVQTRAKACKTVQAARDDVFHPWLHASGAGRRMVIDVKTYVGAVNLMRPQERVRDLLQDIHRRYEAEMALVGRLDDLFHLNQNPGLLDALDRAAPRLDAAASEIREALLEDPAMVRSFGGAFDPLGIEAPSVRIAQGREHAKRQAEAGPGWDPADEFSRLENDFNEQRAIAAVQARLTPNGTLPGLPPPRKNFSGPSLEMTF